MSETTVQKISSMPPALLLSKNLENRSLSFTGKERFCKGFLLAIARQNYTIHR
jgi:hypothetical protein